MEEIARGAVERHLGDVAELSSDSIYDQALTLGIDALIDAGADRADAQRVAIRIAHTYAQP